MPPLKEYHKRIDVLTTREQWAEIEKYAKRCDSRWGEAVRDLISLALLVQRVLSDPAIEQYAKRHKLRWGEAVRQLIQRALKSDPDTP